MPSLQDTLRQSGYSIPSSSRTSGTLAREGITGHRGGSASHQANLIASLISTGINTTTPSTGHASLNGVNRVQHTRHEEHLAREFWIDLNEGWWQITHQDSGQTTTRGLHSLLESTPSSFFACLYTPRSNAANQACMSDNPAYDLEVHVKMCRGAVGTTTSNSGNPTIPTNNSSRGVEVMEVLLGWRSPESFVSLRFDCLHQCWVLILTQPSTMGGEGIVEGKEVSVIAHSGTNGNVGTLRWNQFSRLLIQIRGQHISLDVDGVPVFTKVRVCSSYRGVYSGGNQSSNSTPNTSALGGYLGLSVLDGRLAVRGWKLRGVQSSLPLSRPGMRAMEEHNASRRTPAPPMGRPSVAPLPSTTITPPPVPHTNNSSGGTNSLRAHMEALQQQSITPISSNTHDSTELPKPRSAIGRAMAAAAKSTPNPSVPTNTSFPATSAAVLAASNTYIAHSNTAIPYDNQPFPQPNGSSNPIRAMIPRFLETADGIPIQTPTSNSNMPVVPSLCNEGGSANSSRLTPGVVQMLCQSFERTIVDSVLQDLVPGDLRVTFDDIAALDTAKRLLTEAIVLPLIMPEIFGGIREPWKGVMLFGPPGTGKTMLARAVCGMHGYTFFNASASSLVSKYRGDSEKIVRCLFSAARAAAPSVIFIDEIDSLVGSRDGETHEASRRLKTELFVQIDGITSGTPSAVTSLASAGDAVLGSGLPGQETQSCTSDISNGRVLVLAATNCPWDLDPAMRRRLEKRIYIALPEETARREMLALHLRGISLGEDVDLEILASQTEYFSGSDLAIMCREASMGPMRRMLAAFSPMELAEQRRHGQLVVPPVMMSDFKMALSNTRPSVNKNTLARYEAWEREFSNS